jgi:hypothetical protein
MGAAIDVGSAAVGDFNGDGKPDLLVANPFEGNIGVLLNQSPDVSARLLNTTLTVKAGNQDDDITVRAAPNDSSLTQVWLGGTGGTLLGTYGNVSAIQVDGGSGNTTLTVDLSQGSLPVKLTYNGGTGTNTLDVVGGNFNKETDEITSAHAGTISFSDPNSPTIDYSNVAAIDDTTTEKTYEALDSISGAGQELGVGHGTSPLGFSVTDITGSQNTNDIFGSSYFPYATIYVANKSSVTLTGPTDQATFDVTYAAPTVPFTVQGRNGQDTFNIIYIATVDTITVADSGASQQSILNINDQSNQDNAGPSSNPTGAPTYTLAAGSVERSGSYVSGGDTLLAISDDVTINYSNMGTLTLNGGDNGYLYNIQGNPARTSTTIKGGAGADTFTVSETTANLNTFAGRLEVDSINTATLHVDDSGFIVGGGPAPPRIRRGGVRSRDDHLHHCFHAH